MSQAVQSPPFARYVVRNSTTKNRLTKPCFTMTEAEAAAIRLSRLPNNAVVEIEFDGRPISKYHRGERF